jgi:hypothetical protein
LPTLTKEIIEAAIAGFEAQKQRIDDQIVELRGMLNGTRTTDTGSQQGTTKRRFSATTLKHMREAQQRRWAKVRGAGSEAPESKPRRKMSAAGRKAIAESQKKRWAAKRAAS